ncbi:MAG: hypothetical protein QG670_1348 [Thermoproteota archaeon]|nr:hypothetical protein [Thermoproteota archaeon]
MPLRLLDRINRILRESESSNLIYWSRFFLGIIAGFICAVLRVEVIGLLIGLGFYLSSFLLFNYVLKINLEEVGKLKFYTTGLLEFLLAWITIWTLLNTYLV